MKNAQKNHTVENVGTLMKQVVTYLRTYICNDTMENKASYPSNEEDDSGDFDDVKKLQGDEPTIEDRVFMTIILAIIIRVIIGIIIGDRSVGIKIVLVIGIALLMTKIITIIFIDVHQNNLKSSNKNK